MENTNPPISNPTPVQPTPTTVPHNPNPGRSKWPYILIGLLIILLVPLGAYFVLNEQSKNAGPAPTPTPAIAKLPTDTPTPKKTDATADWTTYTSTKSAFSIKYPSKEFVRLVCPDEDLDLKTRQPSDTQDVVTQENCGRDGRFTVEAFGTSVPFNEPTTDENVSVVKTATTVGGEPAREYVSTIKPTSVGPVPEYSDDIYFDHNGKHFLIHFDKVVPSDVKASMIKNFEFSQ